MTEYTKQMLNREFIDAVTYTEEEWSRDTEEEDWLRDTEEEEWMSQFTEEEGLVPWLPQPQFYNRISRYFEIIREEGEGTRRVPCPWSVDAVGEEEYQEYEKHIKFDMIKKLERDAVLDAVIRPLQQKFKEMLYNPNTKRGRAFALKNIEWAFEEE